jgi:predicted nucleic acid-binding protein
MEVDADAFMHVLSDTLELSRRYRLSSYDASYLELALRNGGPIATLVWRTDQSLPFKVSYSAPA